MQVDAGELAPTPNGKVSGLAASGKATQRSRKPVSGPTGESQDFESALHISIVMARARLASRGVELTPELNRALEAAVRNQLIKNRDMKRASAPSSSHAFNTSRVPKRS